jgi:hypothetical protein
MVHNLGVGAAPSLRISRRSALEARAVRDGAEGRLLRSRPKSHLLGPSGRRDLRVCLGVSRSPNTPLVNIEPKRGEDSRCKKARLGLS